MCGLYSTLVKKRLVIVLEIGLVMVWYNLI